MSIEKKITIDDFIELWKNIEAKDWKKVIPNWGGNTLGAWHNEIQERFEQRKEEGGSFGEIGLTQIMGMADPKMVGAGAAVLPRLGYAQQGYVDRFPFTYVKLGRLQSYMEMPMAPVYTERLSTNQWKITVAIPDLPQQAMDPVEDWAPTGKDSYRDLEEKRSFVKSSLIIAWPKILEKTLEQIGGK